MLHAILYIIPVFIVYLFIRACWVSNATLKTKYKIARLKDELTWLAISGEVNRENKAYAHLYSSIDKALIALPRFNFWVMLYLLIKEKGKVNINEIEKVRSEVEGNSTFSNIFDAYYKLVINYVAKKNIITVLLTFPIWKRILYSNLSLEKKGNKKSGNNDCIDANEYSSFAFYFQHSSPKSLLSE
ncbi:hypothetical protein [Niastella sp. OAS944]|uniref:hypothetical protein n=1 Tax=Niastella sp. OAS944 TaxID=2664089 RepID=UPI003472B88E|nr:hypothetical protein [Chitinophagaceae bacterium OAS944]